MSRVYLAEETALGRRVVIKTLPSELARAVSSERFRREIRLAARLTHPHIVPLLTAGESEGVPWYTMPYLEGTTLRGRLAQGPLPLAEAVSLLRDVARALAYAHEQGVVHRDIKPENVLLTGGMGLVTDFGIAKALTAATGDGHSGVTTLGVVMGTPAYMAPEQGAGDPAIDHRADIYAFGCLAYEALSGSPPFAGRTPPALIAAHAIEAPEALTRRSPNVPAALAELVMRCLAKQPARWPSTPLSPRPTSPSPPRWGTTCVSPRRRRNSSGCSRWRPTIRLPGNGTPRSSKGGGSSGKRSRPCVARRSSIRSRR
jgi:eukaryotic-like serine/threonine-protein kinase